MLKEQSKDKSSHAPRSCCAQLIISTRKVVFGRQRRCLCTEIVASVKAGILKRHFAFTHTFCGISIATPCWHCCVFLSFSVVHVHAISLVTCTRQTDHSHLRSFPQKLRGAWMVLVESVYTTFLIKQRCFSCRSPFCEILVSLLVRCRKARAVSEAGNGG